MLLLLLPVKIFKLSVIGVRKLATNTKWTWKRTRRINLIFTKKKSRRNENGRKRESKRGNYVYTKSLTVFKYEICIHSFANRFLLKVVAKIDKLIKLLRIPTANFHVQFFFSCKTYFDSNKLNRTTNFILYQQLGNFFFLHTFTLKINLLLTLIFFSLTFMVYKVVLFIVIVRVERTTKKKKKQEDVHASFYNRNCNELFSFKGKNKEENIARVKKNT